MDAALLHNELLFWSDKGGRPDGWVYKNYADLQQRLPLSEYQLRKAYKQLREAGYLETKVMKVEGCPTVHFRFLKNFRMETEKTSLSIETEKTSETIYKETVYNQYIDRPDAKNGAGTMKKILEKLISTLGYSQQVKLTDGRLKRLKARLKTFTEAELQEAAQAIRVNPWMQGENPNGVRYGTVDYLLRNDETVDKYLTQPPPEKDRATKAIEAYIARP